MRRVSWCAIALVALAGCSWTGGLIRAAALEHNCPNHRVTIVRHDGNEMARTVQLDVCGVRRVYRDIGGARATIWVDTTPASAGGDASASVSRETRDPTPSVWSDAQIRDLARVLDPQIRACTGGVPLTLTIVLDGHGRVRSVDGNAEASAERACVLRFLGAVDLPGEGLERRVRLSLGGPAVAAPSEPLADLPAAVRARVDTASARILACVGASAAAVEATWSGSGTVDVALRGESDSAVNDCVRSAVGAITVPAGTTPGRLLHSVASTDS